MILGKHPLAAEALAYEGAAIVPISYPLATAVVVTGMLSAEIGGAGLDYPSAGIVLISGASPSEIILVASYPDVATVTVTIPVTLDERSQIDFPAGVTVTVTGAVSAAWQGLVSSPMAASVSIAGLAPRTVVSNAPPAVEVNASGATPITSVQVESPAATLLVDALVSGTAATNTPAVASVVVAGVAPETVAAPGIVVAEVTVTGLSSETASLLVPSTITITITGLASETVLVSETAVATVAIAALSTANLASSAPPSALVWVRTGVPVYAQEAAQGTIVVLNANTLAVSEYSIAALDVLLHEGEVYFVTATGLSKLGTGGVERISWSFSTGNLGLMDGAFGAAAKLNFLGRSDSEIRLTVTATVYGTPEEAFYTLPCESTISDRGQSVLLARDVHTDEWSFAFAGEGVASVKGLGLVLAANKRSW